MRLYTEVQAAIKPDDTQKEIMPGSDGGGGTGRNIYLSAPQSAALKELLGPIHPKSMTSSYDDRRLAAWGNPDMPPDLQRLASPDVRKDLTLTAEQATKVVGLRRRFSASGRDDRGRPDAQTDISPADLFRARTEPLDRATAALDGLLTAEQKARMAQRDRLRTNRTAALQKDPTPAG